MNRIPVPSKSGRKGEVRWQPLPVSKPTYKPSPPCKFKGGLTLRPAKATKGQWTICNNKKYPLKTKEDPTGVAVCSCVGCGPACPGYQTAPKALDPWEHKVTVVLPHLNTFPQLDLCIKLWRHQTIRPYFLVIDTGSNELVQKQLDTLKSDDLEVHRIQQSKHKHPSCIVSIALDLAHSLCRTEYLHQSHTDVFPMSKDFLEFMLSNCSPEEPITGWKMSPRDNTEHWRESVSHTATIFHNPTFRAWGLSWSLQNYFDAVPEEAKWYSGWPDTESGLYYTLKKIGKKPKFLGEDLNHERLTNQYFDHSRSYTCLKQVGLMAGKSWTRSERDMDIAFKEAELRLEEWNDAMQSS